MVLAQPRVLHISVQTSSVETICQNYLEYLVHPYKEYLQLQHSIKSMFTEKGKATYFLIKAKLYEKQSHEGLTCTHDRCVLNGFFALI